MEKLKIRPGSKIKIMLVKNGVQGREMKSSFEKNVSDSSILVSVPIVDGLRATVDQFQELLINYDMDTASYAVEGYLDEVIKVGTRTYWRIRKTSEVRQFFQRADVRVKAQIYIKIVKKWWDIKGKMTEEDLMAMTEDISAGGLAMYLNRSLAVGEIVDITLPGKGKRKPLDLRGEICWQRETEKGHAFKFMTGIKFIFSNTNEKDKTAGYIGKL